MFGYRVGFSGTADLMALFSIRIRINSRWRPPPSWKIRMAISPQRLTIYLYSVHRAVIFAIAQLSWYLFLLLKITLFNSVRLLYVVPFNLGRCLHALFNCEQNNSAGLVIYVGIVGYCTHECMCDCTCVHSFPHGTYWIRSACVNIQRCKIFANYSVRRNNYN